MSTFKAFRVHNENGVISARFDQVNLGEIGSGNVVIQSAYSNINYKDALAVTGKGRIMKRFPLVAGIDASWESTLPIARPLYAKKYGHAWQVI